MKKRSKSGVLIGLGLLCAFYPLAAGCASSWRMRQALSTFQSANATLDARSLARKKERRALLNESEGEEREALYASIEAEGIIARVRIPIIDVDLPVYAGTGEETLQKGVGHWPSSAVPPGGPGTRMVLTGHRGLSSHRLFTRLDELKPGDRIWLDVYDESLAYRVETIEVIEPSALERLAPREGKDLLSLVTCTPYGLNTHRLVVTGERDGSASVEEPPQKRKLPSWRELAFGLLPFALLGAVCRRGKEKRICGKNY